MITFIKVIIKSFSVQSLLTQQIRTVHNNMLYLYRYYVQWCLFCKIKGSGSILRTAFLVISYHFQWFWSDYLVCLSHKMEVFFCFLYFVLVYYTSRLSRYAAALLSYFLCHFFCFFRRVVDGPSNLNNYLLLLLQLLPTKATNNETDILMQSFTFLVV